MASETRQHHRACRLAPQMHSLKGKKCLRWFNRPVLCTEEGPWNPVETHGNLWEVDTLSIFAARRCWNALVAPPGTVGLSPLKLPHNHGKYGFRPFFDGVSALNYGDLESTASESPRVSPANERSARPIGKSRLPLLIPFPFYCQMLSLAIKRWSKSLGNVLTRNT